MRSLFYGLAIALVTLHCGPSDEPEGAPQDGSEDLTGSAPKKIGGPARQVVRTWFSPHKEIFYTGKDYRLYHDWMNKDGQWHGPEALSGYAKKLSANSLLKAELFYIGMNNGIYHDWMEGGGRWHGEVWLGGYAKEIATWDAWEGDLATTYMFSINLNNQVHVNRRDSSGWSKTQPLGVKAKRISATATPEGNIEAIKLAFIGMDDHIYTMTEAISNPGWSAPKRSPERAKEVQVFGDKTAFIGMDDRLNYFDKKVPKITLDAWAKQFDLTITLATRIGYIGTDDRVYLADLTWKDGKYQFEQHSMPGQGKDAVPLDHYNLVFLGLNGGIYHERVQ